MPNLVKRISDDELKHHGVEGQKCGVQNGPPYPLDRKKELKKAYKASKKIFTISKSREYAKNSDAVKQVSNADDIKKNVDTLKKADTNIDNIEKKDRKEIAQYARPEVLKVANKHGWDKDYINELKKSDDAVLDAIYEDVHANGDWTGAFTKLAKTNAEYNKALKEYKTAHDNATKSAKVYVERIVGEYGDEPLANGQKYKDFVTEAIENESGIESYWFPNHHPALKSIS